MYASDALNRSACKCIHPASPTVSAVSQLLQNHRFNLLREENEGFSKMLVRLQSFGAEAAACPDNVDQVVSVTLSPCRMNTSVMLP